MTINISKATVRDSLVLAQMNLRLIRDEKHRNPMNVVQLKRRMQGWLRGEYTAYLFLESLDVVGYCLFKKIGNFVYIRQFYVDRGSRRKGLGRKAFGSLRKKVWKGRKLRLDVLVGNKRAIGFWRAVGFKDYCLTMERN